MTVRRTGDVKKLSQWLHWNAEGHSAQLYSSGSFTLPSQHPLYCYSQSIIFFSFPAARWSSLFNSLRKHLCVPALCHMYAPSYKHLRRPRGERKAERTRGREGGPKPPEANALSIMWHNIFCGKVSGEQRY